ncbi:MAG: hypothetical protein EOO16_10380 [Chitinophagaceae bacterium]|nr:MAG: hypothetical protein EOO16_10380 [Chitinophagaceae bacterium]
MQHSYNFRFASNCDLPLPLPPMRIFVFLMAVLVLVLSMMPCSDVDVPGKNDASQTIVKTAHDHQDQAADNCSPFCQCSCCAGFYVNHAAALADTHPAIPQSSRFPHPPSAIYDRSLPVWQPPKLG